jgi:hypothetical protein
VADIASYDMHAHMGILCIYDCGSHSAQVVISVVSVKLTAVAKAGSLPRLLRQQLRQQSSML